MSKLVLDALEGGGVANCGWYGDAIEDIFLDPHSDDEDEE